MAFLAQMASHLPRCAVSLDSQHLAMQAHSTTLRERSCTVQAQASRSSHTASSRAWTASNSRALASRSAVRSAWSHMRARTRRVSCSRTRASCSALRRDTAASAAASERSSLSSADHAPAESKPRSRRSILGFSSAAKTTTARRFPRELWLWSAAQLLWQLLMSTRREPRRRRVARIARARAEGLDARPASLFFSRATRSKSVRQDAYGILPLPGGLACGAARARPSGALARAEPLIPVSMLPSAPLARRQPFNFRTAGEPARTTHAYIYGNSDSVGVSAPPPASTK
mmetsp:Transcript_29148/g.95368  ORF Transcript_29148/g.95368 Transcript_29148/m.95368 type:complete len:287 (-) Transcript_29148:67-927(-)